MKKGFKGFTPTPKNYQKNDDFLVWGFTVVEILVVIGIIAVLTVIILPSLSNIRAKNRDAERVADISAIQLGLSLYKSQNVNNVYPLVIYNNTDFSPKYVPAESLIGPNGEEYVYVPLARSSDNNKCIYYHLGTKLELLSGQIDEADNFSTEKVSGQPANANGYVYCDGYGGNGLATSSKNYNVRP